MTSTNRKTADIVILGAGVMGASIAFHLAKRKAGRIVVLEKTISCKGIAGGPPRLSACTIASRLKSNSPSKA